MVGDDIHDHGRDVTFQMVAGHRRPTSEKGASLALPSCSATIARSQSVDATNATILQVMLHTPIWVWALYDLLVHLGYSRTPDSALSLRRLVTLPAIILVLTIWTLITADPGMWPPMMVALVVGGISGCRLEGTSAIYRQPDGTPGLRGDWWSFCLLVGVLCARYAANVSAAIAPSEASMSGWNMIVAILGTITSAMLVGRTIARMRTYFAYFTAVVA